VPVIDAQTAAALMNALTVLVARAGAATLSVSRDRMTISG
jgi:3'(2'), 5'-bisphosphate nucleotidase